MSVPEYVLQRGVEYAWTFFVENQNYMIGQYLKELPFERQEVWRNIIVEELETSGPPPVFIGSPPIGIQLPTFAIQLINEREAPDGQFIGNVGSSNRVLPYPQVAQEERRKQVPLQGVTFDSNTAPMPISVDGAEVLGFPTNFAPTYDGDGRRKDNLNYQSAFGTTGDEQFDRMGDAQPFWHIENNRILETVTGDLITAEILVSAGTPEKCVLYYRILRWVMRRFSVWFHVNGILKPVFSGGPFRPAKEKPPAGSTMIPYERGLRVTFLHYDYDFELESVLSEFIISMQLATKRQDGSLDFTPLYETSTKAGFVDENQDGEIDD